MAINSGVGRPGPSTFEISDEPARSKSHRIDRASGQPSPSSAAAYSAVNLGSDALKTLEFLATPIWIWDLERASVTWGNSAALELWDAEDLASLQRHASGLMPVTFDRIAEFTREAAPGEPLGGIWAAERDGESARFPCRFTAVQLDGMRQVVLIEAIPQRQAKRSTHSPVPPRKPLVLPPHKTTHLPRSTQWPNQFSRRSSRRHRHQQNTNRTPRNPRGSWRAQ